MKDGERGRSIENYGKKKQKEWLVNTFPDLTPVHQGTRRKNKVFKGNLQCKTIVTGLRLCH